MSDVSQGPGWWQASDGKWYPPELAPGYQPPAAPVAPAPAATPPPPYVPQQPPTAQPLTPQEGQAFPGTPPLGAPQAQPASQQPIYQQPGHQPGQYAPAPPQKEGMSGCLKAFIVVFAICAVMALGIGACTMLIADDVRDAVDDAVAEAERIAEEAEQAIDEAEQAAEDAGDLVPDTDGGGIGGTAGDSDQLTDIAICQPDSSSFSLTFVNVTTEMRDYQITVNLTDDQGGPVGTQEVSVPAVLPGETVLKVSDQTGEPALGCDVSTITAVVSTNDVAALGDIGPCEGTFDSNPATLQAEVTNSTDAPANYAVLAAVVESTGIRHGVALATTTVEPGETASLTFANQFLNLLPLDFTCEIRAVQRFVAE